MKSKNLIIPSLMIAMVLSATSCKTPQNIEKTTGAVEISVPFSDSKYKTDKDYFRAKNIGKSIDLATSKKIALQNAKSELAGNIQSIMKAVTDQYRNSSKVDDKENFENKFEELSRDVVNQTLTDVRIMDEKIFKETDGKYSYWVAIETSKQSILEGVTAKVSKNEKLQLDYDKKKFEEVFNSEMEKMSKEQ
ncbi:MAG: hypothetical protein ACOYLT_07985 [Flavobacterium sp.]|uniref:hypothetical protein n=1 Tax=Flavobacterium sp. TaxID=239 RepID=UPI003BDE00D3